MELNILRKGNKARAKLDKVQAEITHTAKLLKSAEQSAVSIEEARARLVSALGLRVEDAARRFSSLLAPAPGHVELPVQCGLGELAFLFGADAFVERIIESISDKAGLPLAQRVARRQTLQDELRALQVQEEQEILELEGRGHIVLRRADADVGVLLDVWRDFAATEL